MPTLYQIVIIASLAAFVILFSTKTEIRYKVRDFCDTNKLGIIAKMLDCDFCFSFWTCMVLAILFACLSKDAFYLLIPPFSTPITRLLL